MFQPGDVVQLKSGGPVMTVRWCRDVNETMTVWCDWFDKTDQKSHGFMPAQLDRVD